MESIDKQDWCEFMNYPGYVAKFTDAVYVLHCFQKKTQKTSVSDPELAKSRYRELTRELER